MIATTRGVVPRTSDEAGFTLAEMLVAMLIMGIVFAGAASALMNLSRASVSNERRVQATALMTEIHERFQAMPWDAAVLYPEELVDLAVLDGYALVDGEHKFEELPISLFDGDCDPTASCRWDQIPRPFELEFVDGRQYDVFRVISEVDRAGPAVAEIKRLTTIVRFEVMGRWITQQLDSERAGTAAELDLPTPPGPAFNIAPSTVPVDVDGNHLARIRFDAVFPPEMLTGITNVTATLETKNGPIVLTGFQPVLLAEMVRRFVLEVGDQPAGVPLSFENGTQTVTWNYDYLTTPYVATTPLTFEFDSESADGGSTFSGRIQNVSANAGPIRVLRKGGGNSTNYELCDPLTISATAVDVVPALGDRVRADYTPDSGPATSVELLHKSGSNFEYTFAAGISSPWWPDPSTGTSDVFVITARDGASTPALVSEEKDLSVSFVLLTGSKCP